VRYDGNHKLNQVLLDALQQQFELLPICPEVEIGLGVPREPIRLVKTTSGLRCLGTATEALDVTTALAKCADRLRTSHPDLCGYVFKARSPSCGLAEVAVWNGDQSQPTGGGIYASQIQQNFIDMPVAEAESLTEPALITEFVQQVLEYHRRKIRSTR
jgi:uncharacterized protein YbbK (DUF523 family)